VRLQLVHLLSLATMRSRGLSGSLDQAYLSRSPDLTHLCLRASRWFAYPSRVPLAGAQREPR
jgi:hypothetical protein